MELKFGDYIGQGINHDKEEFRGEFQVQSLPKTKSKSIRYIATRVSDDTKVHEEIGLLTDNENGELEFQCTYGRNAMWHHPYSKRENRLSLGL